ncbi:MAG: cytochrome c, partial [Beijerinckiaceae bacterium]|nr:cytochrome c [Beijerinckiaceae bacterium]
GRYASSPKVWENKADFERKLLESQSSLAGARAQSASGLEGLKAAWPQVDIACSACHESYRIRQQ